MLKIFTELLEVELDQPTTKRDLKHIMAQLDLDLDERFANVPTKAEFNQLLTSVDGFMKEMKDRDEKEIIENYRLSRLEDWSKRVAPKVGEAIDF